MRRRNNRRGPINAIRRWAEDEQQRAESVNAALEAYCLPGGQLCKSVRQLALNMGSRDDAKSEVKMLSIEAARKLEHDRPGKWGEGELIQIVRRDALDSARKATLNEARQEGLHPGNTGRLRRDDYQALRMAIDARKGRAAESEDDAEDVAERVSERCRENAGHVVLRPDGVSAEVLTKAREFLAAVAEPSFDRSGPLQWVWFQTPQGPSGWSWDSLTLFSLMMSECFPDYLEAATQDEPPHSLSVLLRPSRGYVTLANDLFAGASRVFIRRLSQVLPKAVRQELSQAEADDYAYVIAHPRGTWWRYRHRGMSPWFDERGIPEEWRFSLWDLIEAELMERGKVRWDTVAEKLGYTPRRLRQIRDEIAVFVRAWFDRHLAEKTPPCDARFAI